MSKPFFGYVRVSTKRQGDGASLPEQRAAIEAFAAHNDMTITQWFCETRTAAKAGRREFSEMLKQLKRGRAKGVVIHKIDRSARNARDWLDVCDLVEQGVEVRFAHDDLDLTTRAGRLTADLLAAISADFIRNNREQVKFCMQGWVKQGYLPWRAPMGYLNQGHHQLKRIDPRRGPRVAEAFALYAGGDHTLETLRHELARRGLRRPSGAPLGRADLARVLRDPFYCGLIRVRRTGELFPGKHKALISRRLFDEVQARLDGRVFARRPQDEFTYRRLLSCAACSRSLTGERQKGHVYYRCHTRSCRGVCVAEARLDHEVVLPILAALTLHPEELGDIGDIAERRMEEESKSLADRSDAHARDLAELDERLRRMTDALVDGLLDAETFRERKNQVLVERARLSEALKCAKPAPFWTDVVKMFEFGSTAYLLYQAADPAERRRILKSLGSNGVVTGKDVDLRLRFPFAELLAARDVSDGARSRHDLRTSRMTYEALDRVILTIPENSSVTTDWEGVSPLRATPPTPPSPASSSAPNIVAA